MKNEMRSVIGSAAVIFLLAATSLSGLRNDVAGELQSGNQLVANGSAAKTNKAKAVLESKSGSTLTGEVTFTEKQGGVEVNIKLKGAAPGPHGIHLHDKGDCSAADAASAGGHFNPDKTSHGAPDADPHHRVGHAPAERAEQARQDIGQIEDREERGDRVARAGAVPDRVRRDDRDEQEECSEQQHRRRGRNRQDCQRRNELQERRRQEEIAAERGEAQDVNFGSQIRNYVLHPYKQVKDLRTGVEAGDVQRVLDGDLDEFVRAYLLQEASSN